MPMMKVELVRYDSEGDESVLPLLVQCDYTPYEPTTFSCEGASESVEVYPVAEIRATGRVIDLTAEECEKLSKSIMKEITQKHVS